MTNQELQEGKIFTFENDERSLEVSFLERSARSGWANPFRALFNGKLFSYRTYKGLKNKVDNLISKFNLISTD